MGGWRRAGDSGRPAAEGTLAPMSSPPLPEVWLRGPVDGYPALLQPVVHALIQVVEDVEPTLTSLPAEAIWARPGGAASVGFHARHIAGALDRLFTYARGEALTDEQMRAFKSEGDPGASPEDGAALVAAVRSGVDRALAQLRTTPVSTLEDRREVGRKKLPTSVLGLLFHAAEHSTRHAGQIITTAKILSA
jgi:uncharacterized damage-inducible protein DinB